MFVTKRKVPGVPQKSCDQLPCSKVRALALQSAAGREPGEFARTVENLQGALDKLAQDQKKQTKGP